jgi:hypothetical protein
VAKAPGAAGIEAIDEPGGGKRVRLREPNGYQIEVVYGIETLKPIPVNRQPLNTGKHSLRRAGELMRLPKGPSRVKRIGHGVMAAPDVVTTVQWFRDTLGFICSDDISNLLSAEEGLVSQWGERPPQRFIERVCP